MRFAACLKKHTAMQRASTAACPWKASTAFLFSCIGMCVLVEIHVNWILTTYQCTYAVGAFWRIVWTNYAYVVKTLQFTQVSTTHWKRIVWTDTKTMFSHRWKAFNWCNFFNKKTEKLTFTFVSNFFRFFKPDLCRFEIVETFWVALYTTRKFGENRTKIVTFLFLYW